MLFAEHREWGRHHADPLTARGAAHTNTHKHDERLRVGYLSPNFMACREFLQRADFTWHDHTQFEIVCYADMLQGDETTNRLRTYADESADRIAHRRQVCDLMRRDQIDILVDLTGHIGSGRRLLVFARKPAPVQVTYIGYQNTTGMRGMDYRLTDDYSDPPEPTEAWHTETLVPTTADVFLLSALTLCAAGRFESPASEEWFCYVRLVQQFQQDHSRGVERLGRDFSARTRIAD